MIPDGWAIRRFADIADYKTGRTPARANSLYWKDADGGIPWVAISDMTEFGTVIDTKEKITKVAFDEIFRGQIVRAGTLIMSFKLTIGRVATLGIDACHNEAIISIYPKQGIDQRYLGYFLAQVDYDALQDRQVKGNTLNQDKIDRIEVWLPPLDEQLSIANVLDLLRRSIDLQTRTLAVAGDLKRATMRTLFTRGLRGEAQKETEIGPVPESWKRLPICALGEVVTGNTPPTKDSANYVGGEIPFIAPGDFEHGSRIERTEKFITNEGLKRSRPITDGTTCFVCIGSTIGKVGYAIAPICATNQQINSILPSADFDPLFVFYLMTFWSDHVRKQASPSPVPILSKGAFAQIEIFASTDIDEQRQIASILDAIDRKIDLHKRKRAVLDELFKALLHKLMTGEIRVADLDLSAVRPAASPEPVLVEA
jgi:type I restriction enzyme S subunit